MKTLERDGYTFHYNDSNVVTQITFNGWRICTDLEAMNADSPFVQNAHMWLGVEWVILNDTIALPSTLVPHKDVDLVCKLMEEENSTHTIFYESTRTYAIAMITGCFPRILSQLEAFGHKFDVDVDSHVEFLVDALISTMRDGLRVDPKFLEKALLIDVHELVKEGLREAVRNNQQQ